MYNALDWWESLQWKQNTFRSKSQLQGKVRDIFVAFELPKVTNYISFFHMVKGKNDVLSKEIYDSIVDVGIQRFKAYSKVKYDAIVSIGSNSTNTIDTSTALSKELGIPMVHLPKRKRTEMCCTTFGLILDRCVSPCQRQYIPLILESFDIWVNTSDRDTLSISEFVGDIARYYKQHKDRFGDFGTNAKYVSCRIKDALHHVDILDYVYHHIELPRSIKVDDKFVEQKYLYVDDNINTGETIKTFIQRKQTTLQKHATFFCLLGKHDSAEAISSRVKMF